MFKVFGKYDMAEIQVTDQALKPYINIEPRLMVKSNGRHVIKFGAAKIHIIERLVNRLGVPGHSGKKHKIITSWASGKYSKNLGTVMDAFTIIETKTKKNPIQVLIQAVENGSPKDETTTIEYGGARYPQAVDVSPTRRINLALRWIVQGAYGKSFGKKKKMSETLADEIIMAASGNMESYAMSKKNEAEKQADAAR